MPRMLMMMFCLSFLAPAGLSGDEYRVETIEESAPSDDLPPSVAERLSDEGYTLYEGESRRLMQIWLCKEWTAEAGFEATSELLYPFKQGQLIGVVRFRRAGRDFRDQDIERGMYTMRYALQPVDGNHEGTSPTRDFVVLMRADEDPGTDDISEEDLNQISADAAFSNHPAMLCLQPQAKDAAVPSVRHLERREWWVACLEGKANTGDKTSPLRLDLVVIGFAEE